MDRRISFRIITFCLLNKTSLETDSSSRDDQYSRMCRPTGVSSLAQGHRATTICFSTLKDTSFCEAHWISFSRFSDIFKINAFETLKLFFSFFRENIEKLFSSTPSIANAFREY